ncbi:MULTISPECIES: hypothetical protein [Bacillus]|nr:hypothetical protein [Bacillus subtilis]MEC1490563.1 hypothetical protein [Bacillus subtilis]
MTPKELKRLHDIAKEHASQETDTSYSPEDLKRLHDLARKETEKHRGGRN